MCPTRLRLAASARRSRKRAEGRCGTPVRRIRTELVPLAKERRVRLDPRISATGLIPSDLAVGCRFRHPAPGGFGPLARHIPLLGILLDRVLPINRPLCAFRALRRRAITDTALWSQRSPFGLYGRPRSGSSFPPRAEVLPKPAAKAGGLRSLPAVSPKAETDADPALRFGRSGTAPS